MPILKFISPSRLPVISGVWEVDKSLLGHMSYTL